MRVAVRESPCSTAEGPWSVPVALDGPCRCPDSGDYAAHPRLGTVTLVLRDEPTPDGLRYTWHEQAVPSPGVRVTSRVEEAEHGHTLVTGRVLVAVDDPTVIDTTEAALVDAHDRRWDITRTTVRPGALAFELRRLEQVIERGDRAWA